MRRVLVTGGYGNLGSNVTIELAERGYEVVAHGVGDYTPENVAALPADVRERITRRTCDLRERQGVHDLVAEEDVTGVVHSAAILPFHSRDVRLNFDVNAGGTLSLLEAAAENDVERFVYVGTGSVYEARPADAEPYGEDECPVPDRDRPYSITKYAGEMLCEYYRREEGLSTVTTRVSRLWGPPGGATGDWAYPMDRLIDAGLAGEDVVLDHGRDHPNDFTYHGDAARGIVGALLAPADDLQQSVYNVSGGRHVTVDEIAAVCRDAFPSVRFEFGPGHWDELAQSVRPPFDVEAARRDFDYEPRPFEESLREYVAYRKAHADGDG